MNQSPRRVSVDWERQNPEDAERFPEIGEYKGSCYTDHFAYAL